MWAWDDIPLKSFIKAYCDGDMSALYVDGIRPERPDTVAEAERMESLAAAFSDAFGSGSERTSRMNAVRKRETARMNLVIIACAANTIGTRWFNDEMAAILKRIRITVTGDTEKDIARLDAAMNEWSRKMKEAEADIGDGDGETGRAFFDDLLTTMSVWFKFNIPYEITAAQFCSYYRRMREGVAAQKKNAKAQKRKGRY